MPEPPTQRSLATALAGRTFVHPLFDYILIGGGLSFIITAILAMNPIGYQLAGPATLPYLVLMSTGAHFAASIVRLYTKPGTRQALPFTTLGLPFVAVAFMTIGIVYVGRVGYPLETFYLGWSPYHYSAQAYGLAVMYSYRSGCLLRTSDKLLLRWVSMIPFLYMLAHLSDHRLPSTFYTSFPAWIGYMTSIQTVLIVLGLVAPLVLFARVWRSSSGPMPLISLLAVVSNAIWFYVLDPIDAFIWATVFHGIQYMAIVVIFHVKEQMALPTNRHGRLYHVLWFYLVSLASAYGLFILLPIAYVFVGFAYYDSKLISISVINIHHFLVDAYIWRLVRGDSNRRIVDSI